KIYKVDRDVAPRTENELLQEENAKRAAYNLDPLTKIPDWIKQKASEEQGKSVATLVLQDNETGQSYPISGNSDILDLPEFKINPSNDIISSPTFGTTGEPSKANLYNSTVLPKDGAPKLKQREIFGEAL